MLLGFALTLLELATPGGFYFIFFGLSAIVVGILTVADLTTVEWFEWLLFSVFAIVATAIFRPLLLRRFGPSASGLPVDSLVGETATAMEGIKPSSIGKVELRGSAWRAFNVGSEGLSRGQLCRVERVDGLMLHVRYAAEPGSART
jgi:membrane protein implicated in regulation of membrane protease activity